MPEIQMPKLSDTMTEGTLVAWKKKKGDKVSAGDVLAEIETDKATMEWESPEDGMLTEIYVEEGGKVNVGDKIAFVGGEGEEAPSEEKKEETKEPSEKEEEKKPEETKAKEKEPKEGEKKEPEKKEEAKKEPEKKGEPKKEKKEKAVEAGVPPAQPTRLPPQGEEARVRASPVARRIAAELGVDLSGVKGTGPDGRVTETDVRAAAKSKGAAQKVPAPSIKAGESARIQLSGMRKIIAQRLVESLGPVPHFYLNIDIEAGPLMAAREELKSAGEGAEASKITVNDFVLKAAV
jgi:pyruvate dehydrogenase E2 component (dihydrolipoamide acetyltransferase)